MTSRKQVENRLQDTQGRVWVGNLPPACLSSVDR